MERKIEQLCIYCNKRFTTYLCEHRKYCSIACYIYDKRGKPGATKGRRKYTREDIIEILQKETHKRGDAPTSRELQHTKGYADLPKRIRELWSGHKEAIKAAGLTYRNKRDGISKIYLLNCSKRAYLAGVIDGEGSLQIGGVSRSLISISNTSLAWLEALQYLVNGGKIIPSTTKELNPLWNRGYILYFNLAESRDLILQLINYLFIKKEKALMALDSWNINHNLKWII